MIKPHVPLTYGTLGDLDDDILIDKFASILAEALDGHPNADKIFKERSAAHQALFTYMLILYCYRDLDEYENLPNGIKSHFNAFYNVFMEMIKSYGLFEDFHLTN